MIRNRHLLGAAGGVLLVAGGLRAARLGKERQVQRIWRSLEIPSSGRFDPRMLEGLPDAAQRYLLHSIRPGTSLAKSVRLDMGGRIRLGRDSEPLAMSSYEVLAPPRGYVWKARVGPRQLGLSGFDAYMDGWAEMRWWIAGIVPVVRAGGSDLARSAIGRMLGETIFLPSVLLPSAGARWEEIDERRALVRLATEGEEVAMTLEVDDRGALQRASVLRWNGDPKNGPVGYLPFTCEAFGDEQTFAGYTIPTRFEAGWLLGEPEELRFFFGHIEHAEYVR